MKPAAFRIFLLAIIFACSLAAVGSGVHGMSSAEWQFFKPDVYSELAKAPEKAKIRPNPLESDPQAVAAGQILFADHCAECHGDDGKGARKGPSLRASAMRSATPGTLFWILSNGVVRKKMPSWSKLPEPQRWQLVRYLKSLESE
ncbi:MAG TPA: cytochrome c [Candidatus Acidoferrum sp.]|jgi:mono/diheme cytochrome c family protein